MATHVRVRQCRTILEERHHRARRHGVVQVDEHEHAASGLTLDLSVGLGDLLAQGLDVLLETRVVEIQHAHTVPGNPTRFEHFSMACG